MKKLLQALVFLTLVAAAILVAVQYTILTPEAVTEEVLRQVRRGFTGQVKLSGARVHALSAISLRELTLSDPLGETTFVSLKGATLTLDLRGLLAGRVRFSELAIDGLELSLHRGPDGRFTFERYLAPKTAALPRMPRFPVEYLAAAAGGAEAPSPVEQDGIWIDRVIIRGSRVNYLDAYVPIQIHHIAGAMKLDPGQLEILTLRGRAFDRFPVSINGVMALPGPTHKVEVRLDDAPLKPLLAFIPPLNLLLSISREQLEGWIGVVVESHSDPHGQGSRVALRFREMRWSSRILASTISAPRAELAFTTKGVGLQLKVEGAAHMEAPLVRPESFTQDIPVEELRVNFDTNPSFVRLRGYTAKLRSGTLSGAGYASWAKGKPDYELGFNLERVPLPEVGLAGPDSSAMARAMLLSMKGRVLPGGVSLTSGELALGASRMLARGNLVPDGLSWMVRDASAKVELDGSDLGRLLGVSGSVKLAGKLEGALYPQGPLGQLRGRGKLERAQFTLAPAGGGESVPVVVEECALELAGTQLVLPELRGTLLGGRLGGQLALSTQPLSPTGARMNFDLTDVDAASLARLLGAPGQLRSGRITLAGLIGSRVNVGSGSGGPPPAPVPDTRVAGVLASPLITGTSSSYFGLGRPGTTLAQAAPPPAQPDEGGLVGPGRGPGSMTSGARSDPALQGMLFSGNLEARDLVAPLPAALRARGGKNLPELRVDRATARLMWEPDGLAVASIHGQGPLGEITGSVRLEGPGRARGKLVLASATGPVVIELPVGVR